MSIKILHPYFLSWGLLFIIYIPGYHEIFHPPVNLLREPVSLQSSTFKKWPLHWSKKWEWYSVLSHRKFHIRNHNSIHVTNIIYRFEIGEISSDDSLWSGNYLALFFFQMRPAMCCDSSSFSNCPSGNKQKWDEKLHLCTETCTFLCLFHISCFWCSMSTWYPRILHFIHILQLFQHSSLPPYYQQCETWNDHGNKCLLPLLMYWTD